jgi:hypothetical protein
MLVNDYQVMIYKDATMVYLKVLSQNFYGDKKKNHKNPGRTVFQIQELKYRNVFEHVYWHSAPHTVIW